MPFWLTIAALTRILGLTSVAAETDLMESFNKPDCLTPQDFINAERLDLHTPPSNFQEQDPILLANLYEGDIQIPKHQLSELQALEEKNGIKDDTLKWPGGVIPYVISEQFSESDRAVIARSMQEYHTRTCIRFKPRQPHDTDFVSIIKGQGCSSPVGKVGFGQELSLGSGCLVVGVVLHEMMHAVGFWHEQSRWDRDDYVTVYYENIKEGMAYNFQKHDWSRVQNLSFPYDLGSIMHYGAYAFTKQKGFPTILPKNPNEVVGQRKYFSNIDLAKINALYNCKTATPPSLTTSTAVPNVCLDRNKNCEYWAKIGECVKNPSWMLQNCQASCNKCEPLGNSSTCVDQSQHCGYWAKNKECSKNPNFMIKNCARSCGKC